MIEFILIVQPACLLFFFFRLRGYFPNLQVPLSTPRLLATTTVVAVSVSTRHAFSSLEQGSLSVLISIMGLIFHRKTCLALKSRIDSFVVFLLSCTTIIPALHTAHHASGLAIFTRLLRLLPLSVTGVHPLIASPRIV